MPIQRGKPVPSTAASQLVTALKDDKGIVQADALVLRGYLGRSDLLARTKDLVARALWKIQDPTLRAKLDAVTAHPDVDAALPWRLYLSATLDRYVEFDADDVLALDTTGPTAQPDVYTVWLRNGAYTVVSTGTLQTERGFVRGKLVEDYMTQPESKQAVWSEQDYGYSTGKKSGLYCMGG